MKLTTFQQKALEILLYRFQEQKPSEWVTPAEFSMKTSPFAHWKGKVSLYVDPILTIVTKVNDGLKECKYVRIYDIRFHPCLLLLRKPLRGSYLLRRMVHCGCRHS